MGPRPSRRGDVPPSLSLIRRCSLVVLLLSVGAVGVMAQERTVPEDQGVPVVVPGARVRVTSAGVPGGRVTGRLVGLDADKLTILDSREQQASLPIEQVVKLEKSVSRRSRWPEGAVVGALAFLAATCSTYDCGDSDSVQGMVIVGSVGAGLGALVGRLFHSEKWRDLPLSPRRVAVTLPPRAGIGVSFSWGF
jgi:hypothetical protein